MGNNISKSQSLAELGEFELLRKVVIPTVGGSNLVSPLGDDSAFVCLPSGEHDLVVTSDVAPRPLAWDIGHQSYRTWGWYSVVVCISDLAAAGAKPLFITTSLDIPGDMAVKDIKEFFEGMDEASREYGIANGGGNIREALKFSCHGTAVGLTEKRIQLRRNGAHPKDILVSIGNCGRFASAYVKAKNNGFDSLHPDEQLLLCRPHARVNEMQILHSNGLLNAASDNSDGVLGALWNIAEASNCSIEIDMSQEKLPEYITEVAAEFNYNPWNLMFFWGDWQVIVSVPEAKAAEFWKVTKSHNIPTQCLGRACEGPPQLVGITESCRRKLRLIRNESFVKKSFNDDVLSHIEYMLKTSLWAE